MEKIKPFSEEIQGSVKDYREIDPFVEFIGTAKEPVNVQAAFETLRRTLRDQRGRLPEGQKGPTVRAVEGARKILEEWRKYLRKEKLFLKDLKLGPRINEALKVKHEYELLRAKGLTPVTKQPSLTKLARAEKIIKVLADTSGKRLSAKLIGKLALKIVPYVGVIGLIALDAHKVAKSKYIRDFWKGVMKKEEKFEEDNGGEYYHKDVGWY